MEIRGCTSGAVIVAHENTLKRLTSGTRVIEWGYTFPPMPEGGLPTTLVQSEKTIPFDGETIVLKHYGAGHTDTDLVVYFKECRCPADGRHLVERTLSLH